jgi:diaminopimelate decarboxylase
MFNLRSGRLTIGSSDQELVNICKNQNDAFYLYDFDELRFRLELFRSLFVNHGVDVHFAMKANNNKHVLQLIGDYGLGADVVSGGEMQLALDSGVAPQKIVFSGVAKSHSEIDLAIRTKVKSLNVESVPELKRIIIIGRQTQEKLGSAYQPVRICLRVNPDVDPKTHPYISTGFKDNKFGMSPEEVNDCLQLLLDAKGQIELMGLTVHIGSQILDMTTFDMAFDKTLAIVSLVKSKGFSITHLDLGGGLGIDYHESNHEKDETLIREYAKKVLDFQTKSGLKISVEPGRCLVARMGVLMAKVEYIKTTPFKTFVIVNTGMHHLLRPSLYQAQHRIVPAVVQASKSGTNNEESFVCDLVGPICESSDVIAREVSLPNCLAEGDWLAILDAGAYGKVMGSNYNLQPVAKEICFDKGEIKGEMYD